MARLLLTPLVLGVSLALSAPTSSDAAAVTAPRATWAQARSDLPADPLVRFGVLPNGMRYAIMHNDTPKGASALRLRVGSGSLEESDAEQGLAHVLEHMAFRGSTHVPADEMIKILERKGLAFGPDTNAQTGWSQTVYMLDLPRSDADTLATGLMLMRETAGELTIDPRALETERGVVLSEERLRDTPDYRAEKAQIDLFLRGQLAPRRFPIGLVDIVKTASADTVRAFYQANYRPERTTLIAVGDFNPADMEARIKTMFGDWRAKGPARGEPVLGAVAGGGEQVRAVIQPGGSTRAIIAWTRPYDGEADTFDKERRETIENVGLAVLNRRLSELAHGANPPFLGAGAGFENLFLSAKIAVIEAESPPDNWRDALAASERETRRLVADGVTQAEVDREIAEMRAGLKTAVAGASTRVTANLASGLVDAVDQDGVFTDPAEDLKVFETSTQGLTAVTVNAAMRRVFAGTGPLVEVASPKPIDGGESTIRMAFDAAANAPLTVRTADAAVVWPYTDFGKPSPILERSEVADLGVTTARFGNGVRVLVKPTPYRKDQVLVSVEVGGGRLSLPRDRPAAEWTPGAFLDGGYGKLDREAASRALAGKVVSASFALGNTAFDLGGATRPQDLDTELQVLAAYVADPGFRPEALERSRAGSLAGLAQMDATPSGVFARRGAALLTRSDPRLSYPEESSLRSDTLADMKAILAPALARGRIDVTIVGDVTVEDALKSVGETFGALPPRDPAAKPDPAALKVVFPDPTTEPVTLTHTGRPDQAVAVLGWPAPGFFTDMRRSRALMIATDVLGNRLIDTVRVAQGSTYSPESRAELSQAFPDYGSVLNIVEMPPEKIPGFFATVSAAARDMRDHQVTADELERARNPHVSTLRRAQLTNDYWLGNLTGALSDPRRYDLIRTTLPDYSALTLADIQEAARTWFRDETAWRLIIKARAGASAAR